MSNLVSTHWYYAEPVRRYLDDAKKEGYFARILKAAHHHFHPNNPPKPPEINSWHHSPRALAKVIAESNISRNQIVILEARLDTWRRIDAIICGQSRNECNNAILVELKQWSKEDWFDIADSMDKESVATVAHGKSQDAKCPPRQLESRMEEIHARCVQMFGEDALRLEACIYFHNCPWLTDDWLRKLDREKFNGARKRVPIYTRDGEKFLRRKIGAVVGYGSGEQGQSILEKVIPLDQPTPTS